jgi:hypothetical protein
LRAHGLAFPEEAAVLGPPMQLVLLIVFGILGILAGVAQMNDSHTCRYCGLEFRSGVTRCPHCLCRVD